MDCVSIDPRTLLDGIQQFDIQRGILIENVIQKYIKIRIFHEARKKMTLLKLGKSLKKLHILEMSKESLTYFLTI